MSVVRPADVSFVRHVRMRAISVLAEGFGTSVAIFDFDTAIVCFPTNGLTGSRIDQKGPGGLRSGLAGGNRRAGLGRGRDRLLFL